MPMKALVLIGNILFFSLRVIAQESVNQDTLFASFPEQVLKEVVVTPDLLERKADRIVFQVSPSDYGKNGEELLLQVLWLPAPSAMSGSAVLPPCWPPLCPAAPSCLSSPCLPVRFSRIPAGLVL